MCRSREEKVRDDRSRGRGPTAAVAHWNHAVRTFPPGEKRKCRRSHSCSASCSPLPSFLPCAPPSGCALMPLRTRGGEEGERSEEEEEAEEEEGEVVRRPGRHPFLVPGRSVHSPLLALHGRGWGEPDAVAAGLSASLRRLWCAASGHCCC